MASARRTKRRTPAQLAADGFTALKDHLGVRDAIRYIQLYYPGTGDYTRDRRVWLDRLSREDVTRLLAEAPRARPKRRKPRGTG